MRRFTFPAEVCGAHNHMFQIRLSRQNAVNRSRRTKTGPSRGLDFAVWRNDICAIRARLRYEYDFCEVGGIPGWVGRGNAQKQPTQSIVAKKRAGQEDVDSDYLFANSLERSAFRYNPCLLPAGRSLLRVLPAVLPDYNLSAAVIHTAV